MTKGTNSVVQKGDGKSAVISATGAGVGGSVYVFVQSGSDWMEQEKIEASDIEEGDAFGTAVSISVSRELQCVVCERRLIISCRATEV